MPILPSPQIFEALRNAAVAYEVPVTLLMGVAFIESRFNPAAIGPPTTSSGQALGLMQLAPLVAKELGVKDPLNAEQNAMGGARYLQDLLRATNWNVDRALAGYVWGYGNVKSGKPFPDVVTRYVKQVKAARLWYELQSEPTGALPEERLRNAIYAIERLNPRWTHALAIADWARNNPNASKFELHARYSALHERAPVLDRGTPTPGQLDPAFSDVKLIKAYTVDMLRQAEGAAAATGKKILEAINVFGEGVGQGAGVALAAFAFVLLLGGRRRR